MILLLHKGTIVDRHTTALAAAISRSVERASGRVDQTAQAVLTKAFRCELMPMFDGALS